MPDLQQERLPRGGKKSVSRALLAGETKSHTASCADTASFLGACGPTDHGKPSRWLNAAGRCDNC